ncbi:MAG: protein-export chaperone SecB [Prolixibacteraceae bacterium]|nr:protein-export chaperone SecB [Prolixibacteraceae bacterium]
MQKAAFSIEKYVFDKVNIDLNNNISKDISLEFDTKGAFKRKDSEYELTFSVKAFNEEKTIDNPFLFIQCLGIFKFQNVTSFDEIPDFFYRNCIAILFPYLRAYVSLVTTQANVPGIILPTLNLSSLESELRKKTTQK